MLRGLSTISFFADDLAAAQRWYAELLGAEPYFARSIQDQLAYVEFRLGDYQHELGIIDRGFAPRELSETAVGAIAYWHVDDVQGSFDRLVALGATALEAPVQRGPGFVTASVIDPFGNVVGIMFNQHYLDVLGARA